MAKVKQPNIGPVGPGFGPGKKPVSDYRKEAGRNRMNRVLANAGRWTFCVQFGFPRRCFNPPTGKTYWYVKGFDTLPECLEWDTPAKAVDAARDANQTRKQSDGDNCS